MSVIINQVRNAVSKNDAHTEFDLEINHPEYGWIPYSLTTHDTDNTINNSDFVRWVFMFSNSFFYGIDQRDC